MFDGFRGVDQLIWALAYVRAVGLGPLAGVLAIATADIAVLAKLYAEAIENAERRQVEGVVAAGGGRLARLRFGLLPQVLPVMLAQALYFFESNTRSAAILGVVGAGGIGLQIAERIRVRHWDEVAFIILLMIDRGGDRLGLRPPAPPPDRRPRRRGPRAARGRPRAAVPQAAQPRRRLPPPRALPDPQVAKGQPGLRPELEGLHRVVEPVRRAARPVQGRLGDDGARRQQVAGRVRLGRRVEPVPVPRADELAVAADVLQPSPWKSRMLAQAASRWPPQPAR